MASHGFGVGAPDLAPVGFGDRPGLPSERHRPPRSDVPDPALADQVLRTGRVEDRRLEAPAPEFGDWRVDVDLRVVRLRGRLLRHSGPVFLVGAMRPGHGGRRPGHGPAPPATAWPGKRGIDVTPGDVWPFR
jgi:hypothetical protein